MGRKAGDPSQRVGLVPSWLHRSSSSPCCIPPRAALRMGVHLPSALKSLFFLVCSRKRIFLWLLVWICRRKKYVTLPLTTQPHFQAHVLKSKCKFPGEGSNIAYLRVESIEHWKGKNKPAFILQHSASNWVRNILVLQMRQLEGEKWSQPLWGHLSWLCESLLRIRYQVCLSLHPAETWCRGPVSALWLICSQRPNSTFWYLPHRVPGAWPALSVFVKWICCHCQRICYNHPLHPGDGFGYFWIYFETSLQVNLEVCIRASEMAQPAKALAANLGNLGLFPRNHVLGENWLPHKLSSDLHTNTPWHTCTARHIIKMK